MFSIVRVHLPLLILIGVLTTVGVSAKPLTRAQTINLPDYGIAATVDDDTTPEVTDRVSRISFIRGDVQVRHSGSQDWEKAVLNLPVVAGDEITTSSGSRVEIQFDSFEHLRLDENSYLQIVKLQDEGIAVSIPEGRLSVNITAFDKDRSYFEIDAPKTTVAVQRKGMYRVDAGKKDGSEIRVSVTDEGEARVYSENAGFTLKNGRSTRVFIDGPNVGEWETTEAAQYADEFDSWALDRDATIAKLLKNSFYNKYYDNDIYGAEDLNDYGEWIHLRTYGYVWRPYRSAVSNFADWSPYRYGYWRWIPPFGWTWVNDEPWGWATYHHGRWFYENGEWYWSPYGSYRYARSWWFPALVVMSIFNDDIYWYPLPYQNNYYNYNYYYCHTYGWGGHHGGYHPPPGGGPRPTPTPPPASGGQVGPRPRGGGPPLGLPPGAVVTETKDQFGARFKGNRMPPLGIANTILSKPVDDSYKTLVLPGYTDVARKPGSEIKSMPPVIIADTRVKTGAAERNSDRPLDQELRKARIFGDRKPVPTTTGPTGIKTEAGSSVETRKTGAVERSTEIKRKENIETIKPTPVYVPPTKLREERKIEPTRTPPYVPPVNRDPPRRDPPQPKSEPKPRSEPRPSPKSDPPSKSDSGKKKDGR